MAHLESVHGTVVCHGTHRLKTADLADEIFNLVLLQLNDVVRAERLERAISQKI